VGRSGIKNKKIIINFNYYCRHVFRIAPNFRIVALGDSDSAPKWLNAQLNSMFLFCSLPELTLADRLKLIQNKVPKASEREAKKLLKLVERLSQSHDASVDNSQKSNFLTIYSIQFSPDPCHRQLPLPTPALPHPSSPFHPPGRRCL
jgi:hypothetical protein